MDGKEEPDGVQNADSEDAGEDPNAKHSEYKVAKVSSADAMKKKGFFSC